MLFFFCADVSIEALKKGFHQTFRVLLDWSLKYIATRVAQWVHNHGGWVRFFIRIYVVNAIFQTSLSLTCFTLIIGKSSSVVVSYCIPGNCMLCLRCRGHRMCCVRSPELATIIHTWWLVEISCTRYFSLKIIVFGSFIAMIFIK